MLSMSPHNLIIGIPTITYICRACGQIYLDMAKPAKPAKSTFFEGFSALPIIVDEPAAAKKLKMKKKQQQTFQEFGDSALKLIQRCSGVSGFGRFRSCGHEIPNKI